MTFFRCRLGVILTLFHSRSEFFRYVVLKGSGRRCANSGCVRTVSARQLLLGLTGVAGLLLVGMLFLYASTAAFHSDELNVLYHVEKFARGDVGRPGRPGLLWLMLTPLMALDSPAQILVGARGVSWLAVVTTLVLVLRLAWPHSHSADGGAAERGDSVAPWIPLLCVVLMASSGLFMTHGIELRTDAFTTPLTLGALVVLWRRPGSLRGLVLAAVLVAVACLCSQKSLYNALGLALAWLVASPSRPHGKSTLSWRVVHSGTAVVVVGGLIALWFGALSLKSGAGSSVVSANLTTAKSTAFGSDILWSEKTGWLAEAVLRSPALYFGALLGLPILVLRRRVDGRGLASLCVAALMLGVIVIHRGFFPYYIASVEPFLLLPAAWGFASIPLLASSLGNRLWSKPGVSGIAWCVVFLCLAVAVLGPSRTPGIDPPKRGSSLNWGAVDGMVAAWDVTNKAQLQLARDIEEVAGGKVPYLAGIGVAPGFTEVTGYLTGVTRQRRRRNDRNFLATTMRKREVAVFVRTYMSRDRYLRPAERKLLYSSYLPVRPNLYLHGARVRWSGREVAAGRKIEILRDADYRLIFRGKSEPAWVKVNGRALKEGRAVPLSIGFHEVEVGPAAKGGELWLLLDTGVEPEENGKHVDYSVFPKDRSKSRSRYQLYDSKKQGYDLLSPPGTVRHDERIGRHQRTLMKRDKRLRQTVAVEPIASEGTTP